MCSEKVNEQISKLLSKWVMKKRRVSRWMCGSYRDNLPLWIPTRVWVSALDSCNYELNQGKLAWTSVSSVLTWIQSGRSHTTEAIVLQISSLLLRADDVVVYQQTSQIKCLNPITCKNQHRILNEYGLRSLFTEMVLNRRACTAVTARQTNTWLLTWSSSKNKLDCISWSELITVYFIFRQLIYRLYNKKTFLLLQCQPFYFREAHCRLLLNICSRIYPQQQRKWSTRDMI